MQMSGQQPAGGTQKYSCSPPDTRFRSMQCALHVGRRSDEGLIDRLGLGSRFERRVERALMIVHNRHRGDRGDDHSAMCAGSKAPSMKSCMLPAILRTDALQYGSSPSPIAHRPRVGGRGQRGQAEQSHAVQPGGWIAKPPR
jgi:hypothetical protein